MTALWTPPSARTYRAPKVSREHWEAMLAWEATVSEALEWDGGILEHWNPLLRQIDPLLCLAKGRLLARVPGVLPGFYHLVRRRDRATDSFMMLAPLTGPSGEFAEPSDAMLRALRAADLQNPRAVQDRVKRDETARKLQEIDQARDDMDRRDEIRERVDAITRTQVNMSPGIPWAQNAAGAKRPTRGKAR